jgi:hypothetical protein
MPTGTVTNLLTGNQSDCGDTSNPELLTLNQQTGTDALGTTVGFSTYGTGVTISSSTDQAHSGTNSLKCITPGTVVNESAVINATTVSSATNYVAGIWVYAPVGAVMYYQIYGNISSYITATSFTGNGAWQYIEVPVTSGASDTTLIGYVRTKLTAQAITFYVDDCRLATNVTTGFVSFNSATISISPYTQNQGLRSVKIVTPGSVVNEGTVLSAFTTIIGSQYTFSFKLLAPNGSTLHIELPGINQAITGTGTWQTVTATCTATGTTTAPYIRTNTTAQAITFYIDQSQLETGSTAHNWAYGTSSYDLGYSLQSGLLVEEATTNLLTANVSTGTDTSGNTTGFSGVQTANGHTGAETLSSSTDYAQQGSKSLKCITDGAYNSEGIYVSVSGLTSSVSYTWSGWVIFPVGIPFYLGSSATGTSYYYTGTGNWQYVSATFTSTSTSHTFTFATVYESAITFYVDMLQLEQKAYPTSWTLGGTTRNAVTCTIPSNVLNLSAGTIEKQFYITNSMLKAPSGTIFDLSTHSNGGNDLISLYYKVGTGLVFQTSDNSGNSSTATYSTALTAGNHKLAARWDSTSIILTVDGSTGTQITTSTPYLPTVAGTYYIGNNNSSNYYDSLLSYETISKTKRTDSDISNRATNGYTVDNHVTFSAGLTSDLSDILQVILSDGNQAWTDNPQVSVKPTVTDSNKAFVNSISVGSKFTISDSDKSWLDSLLVKNKLTIADNDLSWLDTLLVKSKVSISDANSLWNEIISIASKLKITDSDLAWSDILTIKNKFSIPDNDLNWVDLITLKILSAISDSNFLWQDNLLIKVAFMLADGNCCLDTVENISIASSLTIPDAGEMSETLSVLIQFIINQSGTVEDIVDILNKFTLFDIGQATDLPVVQGKISLQDSGTDIENVLMKSTLSLNDLGFLRDIVNLNNLFTLYDSGIIKEKLLFLIGLLIEDDATDSEAISLLSSLLIKDFGYSVDNAVVNTTLTINDIGVTIEQAIVQVGVLLVDEGYGLDEIVKIFLTEYYDLIVTLEKEYDVIVNVEDIFDAIITYSKQANAKVIK